MEYRVYLTNGIVFKGRRGIPETMRECKGFHRFRVVAVEPLVIPVQDSRGEIKWEALQRLIAAQWGDLQGHTVIVNVQMIQCMVEL